MGWKPGQSGNPKGRPTKGKAISEEMRRLLQGQAPGTKQTNLAVLVAKLVEMALAGQLDAIKYICDRLEGRPPQAVELSGDKARPLHITYVRGSEQGDKEA